MPFYAYKCDACGHAKDVLQKISDEPLADCPACGAVGAFKKQVTAAGFQLKGSGWYVTDFRANGNAPAAKPADGEGKAASEAGAPAGDKAAGASGDKAAEKSSPGAAEKAPSTAPASASSAAPASAPAPAPAPATSISGGSA